MDAFLARAYDVVLQPVIFLIFGLAFLMFIWGLVTFLKDKDSDEGRETGKKNIIWGILGMVIMVSVFGIINIIAGTIGAKPPTSQQMMKPFDDVQNIDVKTNL
ncbi:MAG: hypothetical protein KBD16_01200 [Candidatus Pacebacteria bacterium]|nr:hypothetical protein [Candidatus Paceibacterota bacterium]